MTEQEDIKAKFDAIKQRFKKLGWIPREDLLWLMVEFEKKLEKEK